MAKIKTTISVDSTEALKVAEAGGSADEITSALLDHVRVNAPNIAFVGEKPWKPLTGVNAQGVSFEMPKDQSKPFYHPEAGYILRHFGHLYKPVTEKGK